MGVEKTRGRPWPGLWCRPWPSLWPTQWPTGGQIQNRIHMAHCCKFLNVSEKKKCTARIVANLSHQQVYSAVLAATVLSVLIYLLTKNRGAE